MNYDSDKELDAIDKWLEQTRTSKDDEYDEAIKQSPIIQDILNHSGGAE